MVGQQASRQTNDEFSELTETKVQWRLAGRLKNSTNKSTFIRIGRTVISVHLSNCGLLDTLEASGLVRTSILSWERALQLSGKRVLSSHRIIIGPLAIVIKRVKPANAPQFKR